MPLKITYIRNSRLSRYSSTKKGEDGKERPISISPQDGKDVIFDWHMSQLVSWVMEYIIGMLIGIVASVVI